MPQAASSFERNTMETQVRFAVVDAGGDNIFSWDDCGDSIENPRTFGTREEAQEVLERAEEEIVGIPGPLEIKEVEVDELCQEI